MRCGEKLFTQMQALKITEIIADNFLCNSLSAAKAAIKFLLIKF
jgi:hypothetical protein